MTGLSSLRRWEKLGPKLQVKDVALKSGNSFCESKIEGNYVGDLMTGWQMRGIKELSKELRRVS